MAAKSKRARVTRESKEFDLARLTRENAARKRTTGLFEWDVEAIRAARAAQMAGSFAPARSLAKAIKTEGSILSALENRQAPARGLPRVVNPANDTARASRVAAEGDALFGKKGVAIRPSTIGTVIEHLSLHRIAVCYNVFTPREDGSRHDVEVRAFPIENVRWNTATLVLEAYTEEGIEPIVHGDGRWVVFLKEDLEPWTNGALVALALIWADAAFGKRDRQKASVSHGNSKIIGQMPESMALQVTNADGSTSLSPHALAFLDLLRSLHEELPAGISPPGAKIEMLSDTSTAWQIWDSIINGNGKDAARVLLGSDGTVTDSGGNYIKSSFLFGVRNDIVESDLSTVAYGFQTGTVDVWTAINFGTSDLAPQFGWLIPDADEEARQAEQAKRETAFWDALKMARDGGAVVDQPYVDEVAKRYSIRPVPQLAAQASTSAELFQYDLEFGIVTIDEARAKKGLPPLPNGAGAVTVPMAAARAAAPPPTAAPSAPAPATPPALNSRPTRFLGAASR